MNRYPILWFYMSTPYTADVGLIQIANHEGCAADV